ncbi:hypothetical protein AVEN_160185-1 [Araneus ventricosus]|nr:hypothetical protein AVEN_160185-1 [Araneus ventricosus]
MPEKLSQHDLWWSGPQWLHDKHLPNFIANETPSHDNDETYINDSLSFVSQVKPIAEFITKFSSFSKLTRILAYCFRFVRNIRSPSKKFSGPLTAAGLVDAENLIIQLLQEQEFSVEIHMLRKNKPLPCNSKLLALNIFLDKSGIIRVGGRLSNHSTLNINQKHPMLLPKDHHLTRSIIKENHTRYLHAGPQLLLSLLRQKFWFSHALSIVRQECHKCLTCRRAKSQSCQQLMSDLPSVRITPDRHFKRVGVDFCGLFLTKPNVIRSKVKFKSYVALFICMWSKAVHSSLFLIFRQLPSLLRYGGFYPVEGYHLTSTPTMGRTSRELLITFGIFSTLPKEQRFSNFALAIISNGISSLHIPQIMAVCGKPQ